MGAEVGPGRPISRVYVSPIVPPPGGGGEVYQFVEIGRQNVICAVNTPWNEVTATSVATYNSHRVFRPSVGMRS